MIQAFAYCKYSAIRYYGNSQVSHVSMTHRLPININCAGRDLTFVSLCHKIANDTWLTSPSRYRGGLFVMYEEYQPGVLRTGGLL